MMFARMVVGIVMGERVARKGHPYGCQLVVGDPARVVAWFDVVLKQPACVLASPLSSPYDSGNPDSCPDGWLRVPDSVIDKLGAEHYGRLALIRSITEGAHGRWITAQLPICNSRAKS